MKHYLSSTLLVCSLMTCTFSCKKFVEIPPPNNQIVSSTVFTDDLTASATVAGIYGRMNESSTGWASSGIAIFMGLTADELVTQNAGLDRQFQENQISPQNGTVVNAFWNPVYNAIYTSNLCIEKLSGADRLSAGVKKSLLGEAKFIRAFAYFYLANIFGDVPLITNSEFTSNATVPRTPKPEVYNQILKDLLEAKELLSNSYATTGRNRPNLQTVNALLARVYLYLNDWPRAQAISSEIIGSGLYSMTSAIDNVFQSVSNETIWQLAPVNPSRNTWLAFLLVPATPASAPQYKFRKEFTNDFETGDLRRSRWIGGRVFLGDSVYYPAKYKRLTAPPVTEHYIVFRLAEMYLIRAEANAMQGRLAEACADLNIVRTRAGLSTLSSADAAVIRTWIAKERKVELFTEWGDRWFDLKRTGKANGVLTALKPTTWQSTDTLYPIPTPQILLNPALVQNNGY